MQEFRANSLLVRGTLTCRPNLNLISDLNNNSTVEKNIFSKTIIRYKLIPFNLMLYQTFEDFLGDKVMR